MSVNNTQSAGSQSTTMASAMLDQGRKMLIGGAIGGVAGKAVSLAAPVSHKKIAAEIADHYLKTNENGMADAINNAAELIAKQENNKYLQSVLETIEKSKPDEFSKSAQGIKEALGALGEKIADNAEFTKETAIDKIKNYLKNNSVSDEEVKTAVKNSDDALENIMKTATQKVEDFFKTARKNRSKEDIVAIAKKCAKKTQSAKIIGTAIMAGITTMIFSDVLANFASKFTKGKVQKDAPAQAAAPVNQSKAQTHQG